MYFKQSGVRRLGQVWNTQIVDWYEQAVKWSNYPQAILGEVLQTEIKDSDTVLDAGCGIGAISLYVAAICKRVLAVDMQSEALKILQQKAEMSGRENVKTYLGMWPEVEMEEADVTVCTYSPPISRNNKGLEKLLNLTRRTGIILTPCLDMKDNDAINGLACQLGLPDKNIPCANGCWEKGFLESKGLDVKCQILVHDFSQPVKDYQEAWNFLRHQLDAPEYFESQAIKEIPKCLETKDGQLLIPIIRKNCLIIFRK